MKRGIPFDFLLEELESPLTRPMFGCTAVYVGEKIVMILRLKQEGDPDNGIWLATTLEHHESLLKDFPSMRSLSLFGPETTGWQLLPVTAPDFEASALKACALIREGDLRIGKIPKQKRIRPANSEAPKRRRLKRPARTGSQKRK